MQNILFIISGPSGVGKGTLVKRLLAEDCDSVLALSVSCTTRLPRANEVDGKDYFFLTEEEFFGRGEDAYLETDEHFGYYYGTPKAFVLEQLRERSVILEIDVVGALTVAQNFRKIAENPVVLIMIEPPTFETLLERLGKRASEDKAACEQRLARVRFELSHKNRYDYCVINDDLETAVRRLQEIIETERNKERR